MLLRKEKMHKVAILNFCKNNFFLQIFQKFKNNNYLRFSDDGLYCVLLKYLFINKGKNF